MKLHACKWLVLAAGMILILAMSAYPQGQRDKEYEVYDAVMRHMFAGGITQFDMNAKVDRIVIRDHTHSEYAYHGDREQWDKVKIRLRLLTDEIIADYESVRKNEKEVKNLFEPKFEYSLISKRQLKEIFGDSKNSNYADSAWTDFYKLYPRSAGYNSVSKVGFDKEKRRALVYFVNWCGGHCGTGTYLLLESVEEKWTVKESAGIWIS